MALNTLRIQQFRNIAEAHLEFRPGINLIYGENGSGKTSLLEAIYYLAHGRSFRSSKPEKLIRYEQPAFLLNAKVEMAEQLLNLGLQREREGELRMRLNGEDLHRVSELAQLLPVQLITPESFRLLLGGAKRKTAVFRYGIVSRGTQFLFLVEQIAASVETSQCVVKNTKAL